MLTATPAAIQVTAEAGGGIAVSGSGYTINTWHHAGGVFATSTSRTAYIDGVAGSANTTSTTQAGLDNTTIGYLDIDSNFNFMSGRIAEAAIWNVVLTSDEMAVLAKGYSPLFVRPESLVGYWPLRGRYSPEIDVVGAADMTVTGAVAADHPRILLPGAARTVAVADAAGQPMGGRRSRTPVPFLGQVFPRFAR